MPRALDAPPAALPRSLALSSLSYLTAVVVLLLVRSLLPAPVAPLEGPVPFPEPPHWVDPYVPAVPAPDVPPVRPAVAPGPIVPVEPRPALPDVTLPRQDSMPAVPAGAGGGAGSGNPSSVPGGGPGPAVNDDPPLGEWVPAESMPVLVKAVLPDYPAIAQQAGMEGTVVLLLLVGRDGRVRRAQVAHPGTLFDDAAVAAGRQFVFTPATMNGHPVSVWVSQSVRFVLR